MVDYAWMGMLLCFLAGMMLVGSKSAENVEHFFDLVNTKAMRGFWCIVVILVHIPYAYQNRIQDLVGSFGYIGVTFFFMTSGYGLSVAADKKAQPMEHFWRKRLPKLLITGWAVNILFAIANVVAYHNEISLLSVIRIDEWVKWLLGCYFLFWVSYTLFRQKNPKVVTAMLVVAGSLLMYVLSWRQIYGTTIWATECMGFLWGMALATKREWFATYFRKQWLGKWVVCGVLALGLGVAYLKCKTILFLGDYLLKILLGVAITLFILIANVRICIGNKVSLFLGEISFEVYLVHWFAFALLEHVMPGMPSGAFIVSSILITILVAWGIHLLVKRVVR